MLPRVLVWLSLLSASVLANYGPRDSVVILTDKNFERKCGHCKQLEPEYKAAAKKLKKHVRFYGIHSLAKRKALIFARLGVVDATVEQQLAHKYQIKGFPTIKEFGVNKKRSQDYRGGRTSKDIVQYVKNLAEAKKLGVSSPNVVTLEYDKVHTGKKMKHSAMSGTKDERAISEFVDKLIDGSSSFSVTSKDPETLAAAVAGLSAKHEEL
ncbi:hypothetical protein PsorP6_018609 [Peronosclerospora sorghi]|nr:hypothetical protein PsorP6_018609 [Peronosclerospora sorghi]